MVADQDALWWDDWAEREFPRTKPSVEAWDGEEWDQDFTFVLAGEVLE